MTRKLLIKSFLVCTLVIGAVHANEPLPKLELGVGVIGLRVPDYRGSSESSNVFLPTPYIKYRGDRLLVDEGASGILFKSDDLILTVSGNLTFPADDDTPEREGMEELSATIELGPSLNYRFAKLETSAWWLDLPLRFAYTLDSDFESAGQVFQPRLSWRKPSRYLGDWKLRFNIGPLYASDAYHDYYYSVADSEALVDRPEFEADGGLSGARVEFTYSKRIGDYWIGGFTRYDSLRDSVIDDSPLVSEKDSWLAGFAFAWVFHQE